MKKILIIAAVIALFASGLVFAVGSVSSVDTSLSASSATTGTSVVLTATSTASSEDVSNTQIQIIKDSGPGDFSVSDPSGGSYTTTVTTSGTSKTFTFTAGSAGTYTYYVNDVYSDGSKASTTETMEFVAPSSLSVSGSASAVTVAQGQSTSLTVNVQNSQASNILTSYSLTYATSNLSITGDPTSSSGTTVNAGTTKSLAWTITHSSCFTGTKTVVFALGDNTNAHTLTITGNSSCTTTTTNTTTSSSSSGGAGSNATTNATVTKESQSFSSVGGTPLTLKFTKITNGVTEIELTTLFNKNSVQMSVADGTKPSAGDPVSTGAVYKYIEITKINAVDSDFSLIKIRFKVPKTWITTNNIDSLKVSLYRYSSGWDKLVTTRTSSDSTYYYYEAISPGFSTFSIAGEAAPSVPANATTPTPTPTGTPETGNATETPSTGTSSGTVNAPSVPTGSTDANVMVGVVVLVLAVLFGIVYHFFLTKPKKYNYAPGKK